MMAIDERSSKAIATLRPKARPWFEELYRRLNEYLDPLGLRAVVTSGNRTFKEQDALYAKGRTTAGPKVTNARGGQSNHNYGIAVDITIFKGGTPKYESPHYAALGKIGKKLGLAWGGDWASINDEPHFEIKTGRKPTGAGGLLSIFDAKGWSGIDGLVPEFTGGKLPTPPKPEPVLPKVEVFYDAPEDGNAATRLDLDAWFDGSYTWVGIDDFVDYFGGEVVAIEGTTGAVNYRLNAVTKRVSVKTIGKARAAKFGELNVVLGLAFSWDGKLRRLTVHR